MDLTPCELATVLIFSWFYAGGSVYFVTWGLKGAGLLLKTFGQ